ncbi:MAG: preprotein translocase subunit SecE [Clostridiales bacterium]|nr:preprotein translocase subunit SecE [Clostridiales bacterium]
MAKQSKDKVPANSLKGTGDKNPAKKGSLVKAAQKTTQKATQKRKKGSIKEYFKGVKLEMKKVVWPTKKELGSFTVVVLVACAAFAIVFWAVDTGVLAAIKAVCF